MKIIAKTKAVLYSNRAETITEVLVAFLVLSIVMVLFAQGLKFAAAAENYAVNNTKSYDNSMFEVQKTLAGENGKAESFGASQEITLDNGKLILNCYRVKVDGDSEYYYYWVFDAE